VAPRPNTRAEAERSFEELYRGHRSDVYRAALRELGNVQDAEDVTQAAFVDAYRAVLRGTRPHAPRAWLLTIAENVRRRRFATSLRRLREEPLLDPDTALAADESNEQAGALLDALAALTTEQREAFLLREITGLSYDEIARRMDSTVASVQMLLFRARKTLRDELDPPHAFGALVPLATLFSRIEAISLRPRAVGAVGASVLALGVGATAPTKADPPPAKSHGAQLAHVPATAPAASAQPTRRMPATKPATSKRRLATAAPVRIATKPVRRSPPVASVAPRLDPARSQPEEAAAPSVKPTAAPAPVEPPLAERLPVAALPVARLPVAQLPVAQFPVVQLPVESLPVEPALLEAPAVEPLLERAGAAGAAGAGAPPLPVLPLDSLAALP
jgi:RNA polymerase sigma factor (sigma-70 family)